MVTYDAKLNENALIGSTTGNNNSVKLVWSNAPYVGSTLATHPEGNGYGVDNDSIAIYTYALVVNKFETGNQANKLVGAEFKIYTTPECDGEVIATIVTDENGYAMVYGLAFDTYYVKETKAPAGYKLAAEPFKVELNATANFSKVDYEKGTLKVNSYVDGTEADGALVLDVENTLGGSLPSTGGIGTIIFIVVGLLVAGSALIVLVAKRRVNKMNI